MKTHNWNMWSIISVFIVLLSMVYFAAARIDRSKISELRCYTCDQETCKGFDRKKIEPKNCTADDLSTENLGPTLLRNLTHVPFSPIGDALPQFVCQKIEAYSVREGRLEVRRCALQLAGNQTCDNFFKNQEIFARDVYINASCALCDYDSCNSGAFNSIWLPILFTSIISYLLMK